MRGVGFRNIIAEGMVATQPLRTFQKSMNRRRKLCWKCQKDKQVLGGHLNIIKGGPLKFICKDCLDSRGQPCEPYRE